MKKIGLWILVLCLGMLAVADDADNPPGDDGKNYDECDVGCTVEDEDCDDDGACVTTEVCCECIKTSIGLGKSRPGSALPSAKLLIFTEDPSPVLYTPQSMSFSGSWSIRSISTDRTEAGAPRVVHMFDPKGRALQYDFEDDESVGLPDDHLIEERRFTRLFMVDAEGWATLTEPAYYDLYTKDGDLYRFDANPSSAHYLELCLYRSASGYEETLSDTGVELIKTSGGILRQVRTATRLADIVIENSSRYRVDIYADTDISEMDTNGCYTMQTGAVPLESWVFENPEPGVSLTKFRISKSSAGFTKLFDYIYDSDMEDWTLIKGDGLQKTVRSRYHDDAYQKEENSILIQNENGQIVSEKMEVNEKLPFGKVRSETRVNTGTEWLAVKYSYYTDINQQGYGQLKSEEGPAGLWQTFDYDTAGRISVKRQPCKDSAMGDSGAWEIHYDYTPHVSNSVAAAVDHRPHTVTEQIGGITVAKTFYAYITDGNGDYQEVTEQALRQSAVYGDSDNLRTVKTYYGSGDDLKGRLKTVQYPDGRLDTYTYERGVYAANSNAANCAFTGSSNGLAWRETVVHGVTNSPDGVANLSTKETIVKDQYGNEVLKETYVYTGSGYERIQWLVKEFDTKGHMLEAYYSDGRRESASWDSACCGKDSDVDEQGVEQAYTYDPLGRLTATVKFDINGQPGLTVEKTYDAAGRVLSQTRSGGGLELITSNRYDLAGRLLRTINSAGLVTEMTYLNGGHSIVRIQPGGTTNRTERYIDGQVKNVIGSDVVEKHFDYGVNADGSTWTKEFTASSNSPVWKKVVKDMAGRIIRTEKPAFSGGVLITENTYDSGGLLTKVIESALTGSTTSTISTVFYDYDAIGNRTLTALDLNGNEALDLDADRITLTENSYQQISNDWYRVTENRICPEDGSTNTLVTSTRKVRLTGLGSQSAIGNLQSEIITTDIYGNDTITRKYIERDAKTVTQITDVPTSTQDVVQVSVNGLLVSAQSASSADTLYSYDALERRTAQFQASGFTSQVSRTIGTLIHYNELGQIDWVSDAASNKTWLAYDPNSGRKVAETNALGHSTLYQYNDRGQITVVSGSAQYPVEYSYDEYGRKTALYTLRGATNGWDITRWHYDAGTGLVTNKVYADGNGPSYGYTPDGKLATRTWARGITTTYSYDPAGSLTNTVYSDGTPSISIAYNRLGQKTQVVDASGTNTFAYDSGTLALTNETNVGQASSLSRSYDSLGRSAGYELHAPSSMLSAVAYGYDDLGRFTSVSSAVPGVASGAVVVNYSYLEDSDLLSGYTTDSGFSTAYGFEPNRNNKTVVLNQFGTNIVSQFDYTYDELNRRTQRTDLQTLDFRLSTNSFGYNDHNELISALMGTNDYSYAYDNIGNRITAANNSLLTTYGANALNQYTNIASAVTNVPTCDLDGNLLSYNGWTFTWNGENRLIQASNATTVVTFKYNGSGRRISKTVSTFDSGLWTSDAQTAFAYDGWNLVSEIRTHGSEVSTNSYVWGLDLSGSIQGAGGIGGLLSAFLTTTNQQQTTVFYCYDANGNVTDLVGTNGTVQAHYEYDPFGNVQFATGNLRFVNPFRFSTKYYDDQTGLYYYGYRYYSPELGRWLSKDPLQERGGANLYAFCLNNPVNYCDPVGLKEECKLNKFLRYWYKATRNPAEEDAFQKALAEMIELLEKIKEEQEKAEQQKQIEEMQKRIEELEEKTGENE